MVVTEAELVEAVARDRAAGRTIAFANGCFDLLHVGHVRYLQGAAAEADRLIVAVNDDRSVAGLKGEGRPILPAAERAELVAALRGVDYVVVFGDANVERLLLLAEARRALQRHRLHRRHRAGARRRRRLRRPHGDCRRPEAATRRASCSRASPDQGPGARNQGPGAAVNRIPHRPPRRAGRHRARDSGRGGAAPRVSRRADRLAGQREASRDPRSRAGHRSAAGHQRPIDRLGRDPAGTSLLAAIGELRRTRYDVAIDLQGLIKSAVLARASGAPRVVGFSSRYARERVGAAVLHRRVRSRAAAACTIRAKRGMSSTSTSACSSVLGIDAPAREFPIEAVDSDAARSARASRPAAATRCSIPGAAWPNKRWPPARLGGDRRRSCASGTG